MFNKKKFKSISEHEVSKHDYVISYINSFLIPVMRDIKSVARRIYIKQEAARVFPSDDNPYLTKLNLTLISLHTRLIYLLEEYDRERNEVIKMIDEDNLKMAYPAEGYELVQFEVERILEGK
jgi:hypothetical protein